jgi:hypothetical protein
MRKSSIISCTSTCIIIGNRYLKFSQNFQNVYHFRSGVQLYCITEKEKHFDRVVAIIHLFVNYVTSKFLA